MPTRIHLDPIAKPNLDARLLRRAKVHEALARHGVGLLIDGQGRLELGLLKRVLEAALEDERHDVEFGPETGTQLGRHGGEGFGDAGTGEFVEVVVRVLGDGVDEVVREHVGFRGVGLAGFLFDVEGVYCEVDVVGSVGRAEGDCNLTIVIG